MNSKFKIQNSKWTGRCALGCLLLNFVFLVFDSRAADGTNSMVSKPDRSPATPREFFNAGTRMLEAEKFREAEAFLETCLQRQDERLQSAALYNLGHTRFAQGVELLENAPDSKKTAARAQGAAWQGAAAFREAEGAMASREVERMVQAYLQGRGARKELNAAIKAVVRALEAHAEVLNKWQRAAGDFKSAAELNPADQRARENAAIVERHIARLIDEIRAMQQALAAAAQMQQQLGEKLKQLRGQIPDDAMPPGAPGDGEEEDDLPDGLQPGMQEGPSKSGEERKMSSEEAGQILNGFRLDGERRLPMGEGKEAPPKDPNRKTW
jgi:tetratricopeptide (TPR) repeat protein